MLTLNCCTAVVVSHNLPVSLLWRPDYSQLSYLRPIERGHVTNWKLQEAIWLRVLNDVGPPLACSPNAFLACKRPCDLAVVFVWRRVPVDR